MPNWLTLGAAAVALTWRLGYGGTDMFLRGFTGAAAAGLFLIIPFMMRGAGGGDVKMLFGAGAIVGWGRILAMLWLTSFAGVVVGIAMLLAGKLDGARLRHCVRSLFDWRYDRRAGAAGLPPKDSERVRIPFSIPITFGMVAVMAF